MIRQFRYFNTASIKYQTVRYRPTQLPTVGNNIFSKPRLKPLGNDHHTPKINPLLSMHKDDIVKLSPSRYQQLVNMKMNDDTDEVSHFCINLVEIIEANFLVDHRLIEVLLKNLPKKVTTIILETLKYKYRDNDVKLSFIENLSNPSSNTSHSLIHKILHKIMKGQHSDNEKFQMMFNYLKKLSELGAINQQAIYLSTELFDSIYEIIPPTKMTEFYALIVNLNLRSHKKSHFNKIIEKLNNGNAFDKFVLRTGCLNPNWKDTVHIKDPKVKEKLYWFSTFDRLIDFTKDAIKRKDLLESNLYLELAVRKFEYHCNQYDQTEYQHKQIKGFFEDIIKVSMVHLMTFKHPKECLRSLKYLNDNKITLNFKILNSLIKNLRINGYFKESILVINHLKLDNLPADSRSRIVDEIFKITNEIFSDKFDIILGYAIKMFKLKTGDIEIFLKNLKLFSGNVQLANVDKNLSNIYLTHENLYEIYKSYLKNNQGLRYYQMLELFDSYLHELNVTQGMEIDDKILTLFLNHLNKTDPYSNKFVLFENTNNFEVSKKIVYDFLTTFPNVKVKPYIFDILINQSLAYNNFNLSAELIKKSRSLNLPFTFHQIFPFIKYHYKLGQFENARIWYNLLLEHGIKCTNYKLMELFKIAKELGWGLEGMQYKREITYKNRIKRYAVNDLKKHGLDFISSKEVRGSFDDALKKVLTTADSPLITTTTPNNSNLHNPQ